MTMIANPVLKIVVVVGVITAAVLLFKKPYYTFSLFFLVRYVEQIILRGSRQRVMIAVQVIFYFVCFLFCVLRNLKDGKLNTNANKWIIDSMVICIVSQLVFSLWGLMNGYLVGDVLINNYKFMEIFIFYFVISTSVQNTHEMEKALHSLLVVAMCLGIYEMITTIRGSVGLLILMNFGSLFFCDGIINDRKHWKLVAIFSALIVILSTARSYMIGYFISIFISYLFLPTELKRKTRRFAISFAVLFVIAIIIFSTNERIVLLLTRIAGLGEGLDKAGGYRWAEFQVAFDKFLEEPLGRGLGYMERTFIRYMGEFDWGDYMHIATGEILLKTGIFGTLLYFGLIVVTAFRGYRHIQIAKLTNDSTLYAMCVGGFAGLISRIVLYNMSSHNTYGFLFLPIIFSDIYFTLYEREHALQKYKLSGYCARHNLFVNRMNILYTKK